MLIGSKEQKSFLEKSDFIYRLGNNAKSLALTKDGDWQTGLSFLDYPYGKVYLTFRVSVLVANGYVVKADGNQPIVNVWTNQPYIGPYDENVQQRFPDGHVSVWHTDKAFWDHWYNTDKGNYNTPVVSLQLQRLFDLREKLANGSKAK